MTLDELHSKYGEPLHIGSKHLVWKDTEQNRAIKATRPGYFEDGSSIVTSQPWHQAATPSSPHPSTIEMTECMHKFGFSQMDSNDWKNADGVIARNVKPSDFIKTKDSVIPIDIHVEKPSE